MHATRSSTRTASTCTSRPAPIPGRRSSLTFDPPAGRRRATSTSRCSRRPIRRRLRPRATRSAPPGPAQTSRRQPTRRNPIPPRRNRRNRPRRPVRHGCRTSRLTSTRSASAFSRCRCRRAATPDSRLPRRGPCWRSKRRRPVPASPERRCTATICVSGAAMFSSRACDFSRSRPTAKRS